jgi:hypothetical protein
MKGAIAQEDTFNGAEDEFAFVVGSKIGPTGATKNSKRFIVWFGVHKSFNRSVKIDDFAGYEVNQKGSCKKSLIPEF